MMYVVVLVDRGYAFDGEAGNNLLVLATAQRSKSLVDNKIREIGESLKI